MANDYVESMKYKFIQSYATARQAYAKGKVYILDPHTAGEVSRTGIAEQVLPELTYDTEVDEKKSKRKGK